MSAFSRALIADLPDPGEQIGNCEFGHSPTALHRGICPEHWAHLYRDPFIIRRDRRRWHERLRHWWTQYGWCVLVGLVALCYVAVLLWLGDWWRVMQAVRGW